MTSPTWQPTNHRSKAHGPPPNGKERPSLIGKDSRNIQKNIPQSGRYTLMSCMEIAVSATRMVDKLQEAAKHRAFTERPNKSRKTQISLSMFAPKSKQNIYKQQCKPACCQSICENLYHQRRFPPTPRRTPGSAVCIPVEREGHQINTTKCREHLSSH